MTFDQAIAAASKAMLQAEHMASRGATNTAEQCKKDAATFLAYAIGLASK